MDVAEAEMATNDDGAKFAPVTVTDWPCTRSVSGVTVIDGGGGSGALLSKPSACVATIGVCPNA